MDQTPAHRAATLLQDDTSEKYYRTDDFATIEEHGRLNIVKENYIRFKRLLTKKPEYRLYICISKFNRRDVNVLPEDWDFEQGRQWTLMTIYGQDSTVKTLAMTRYYCQRLVRRNSSADLNQNVHVLKRGLAERSDRDLTLVYVAKIDDTTEVETLIQSAEPSLSDDTGEEWVAAALARLFRENEKIETAKAGRRPFMRKSRTNPTIWDALKRESINYTRKCIEERALSRTPKEPMPRLNAFEQDLGDGLHTKRFKIKREHLNRIKVILEFADHAVAIVTNILDAVGGGV